MPEVKPLSARSALLSLVLGAPADGLTAQELVRHGAHVGLSETAVRVALTRAVAAEDLVRDGTAYRLGPRLLARRRRQEDLATVRAWDGSWEMTVVVGGGRPSRERAAQRALLREARMAELREGVWLRPANLAREQPGGDDPQLRAFRVRPTEEPRELAGSLWDLDGWAAETRQALDDLAATSEPARRLAVAAHLVRQLAADPLLPDELLPEGWPADRARREYADYQRELRGIATEQPAAGR